MNHKNLIIFCFLLIFSISAAAQEEIKHKEDNANPPGKSEIKTFRYNAYFRIMARNDMGHGSQTLGWWQLYGRLLNEVPWFQLEMAKSIIIPKSSADTSANVVCRIEGNSFRNGDENNGNLSQFAVKQFYIETENTPFRHFVTQTGTLWYNMGYVGIYDMYIAQTFWQTVGTRAGMRYDKLEWYAGVGDSGFNVLEQRRKTYPDAGYNSVPTIGGLVKANLGAFIDHKQFDKIQLGISLMIMHESGEDGNPNSPHQTANIYYSDVLRGDVLERYIYNSPLDPEAADFPGASPVSTNYWRHTFWMGYGPQRIFGPITLKWNDLSMAFEKKAPELALRFAEDEITKDIYISKFTDDRYELTIVDESQWEILPGRLDMNIGLVFGKAWDKDNHYLPDDNNRLIYSFLVRPQYYITRELHALFEFCFAMEKSATGNRYREHYDSIQSNINGIPDPDGLEWGDTDTKYTLQYKLGAIFNPNGKGIYNRPSIRLLFGAQYSNVQAAFGNSYDESLDRQNYWNKREDIHWHYIVSIEAEHWFSN